MVSILQSQLVLNVVIYFMYWGIFRHHMCCLRVVRLIFCLARLCWHQDGAPVATHCRSSTEAPLLSSELKIHVL